jgi:hypothetical protein
MRFVWTEENVQTAIGLWNSGRTGREIAEAIHAPSRGAVTRKIGRLRTQGVALEIRLSPIREAGVFIWTAQSIQTAVKLWNEGKTGREIAEAIHAPSRSMVTRKISRLRAQGAPIEARRLPIGSALKSPEVGMFVWTTQNIQIAVELWNEGKTGGEIAEVIKAPSQAAVRRKMSRLRAKGVSVEVHPSPLREAGMFTWTAESIQTAIALWNAGRTGSEIAEVICAPSPGSVTRKLGHLRVRGILVARRRQTIPWKIAGLRVCRLPRPVPSVRVCPLVEPRRSLASLKPVNIEAEFVAVQPVAPERYTSGPVLLVEAGSRQCRYPLWDKRSDPRLVCGKRTVDATSSWCEEHHRLVWKTRKATGV